MVVPSISEVFLESVLGQITERFRKILHPSLYQRMLREVGVSLSQLVLIDTSQRCKTAEQFKLEDLRCILHCLKSYWGWDYELNTLQNGGINVVILGCPFGKVRLEDPHLCEIALGILGGIAGERFGFIKMSLSPDHGKCRLTIFLDRSPQSAVADGTIFPLESRRNKRALEEDQILARLSVRERQVVRLIGEGLSDKEIADILKLSVRTVEGHISRIREKSDIRSRSALVRLALRTSQSEYTVPSVHEPLKLPLDSMP